MKPLQSIAMGLLIVVLSARFHGYDALPDPVGWGLVLFGVQACPADLPHRSNLLGLGALAGVVSAIVWFPAVAAALADADASLTWAANLPQLLFTALLCHALAVPAEAAGDTKAARWLRLTRTATIVIGLLPVLVFGAGLKSFELTSYVAAAMVAVLLIWLLFSYASRPWARPAGRAPIAEPPPTS